MGTSPLDADGSSEPVLSLVVKGDTDGCEEAVCACLMQQTIKGVKLEILRKGVGDICKNDIVTASTGSRLVVGFNVKLQPKIEELCRELGVEVRIYSIIYRLQQDIAAIAASLPPREPEERIVGTARVIALFKSSRRGIIIGCEVENGQLRIGSPFRIIAAMGPVYCGIIESMQIERTAITRASRGQQVGIKIRDFKSVNIGDYVESFELLPLKRHPRWRPSGSVLFHCP